jgi:hypothetical protein
MYGCQTNNFLRDFNIYWVRVVQVLRNYCPICHIHIVYKRINCCSYYKVQAYYSRYAVAQVNFLEKFLRIND